MLIKIQRKDCKYNPCQGLQAERMLALYIFIVFISCTRINRAMLIKIQRKARAYSPEKGLQEENACIISNQDGKIA